MSKKYKTHILIDLVETRRLNPLATMRKCSIQKLHIENPIRRASGYPRFSSPIQQPTSMQNAQFAAFLDLLTGFKAFGPIRAQMAQCIKSQMITNKQTEPPFRPWKIPFLAPGRRRDGSRPPEFWPTARWARGPNYARFWASCWAWPGRYAPKSVYRSGLHLAN